MQIHSSCSNWSGIGAYLHTKYSTKEASKKHAEIEACSTRKETALNCIESIVLDKPCTQKHSDIDKPCNIWNIYRQMDLNNQ